MTGFVVRVDGVAAPQGSKSVSGSGHLYDVSKRVRPWRRTVKDHATKQMKLVGCPQFQGPVVVTLDFALPRPASHYRTGRFAGLVKDAAPRFPVSKPDVDKLTRAVLDSLTGSVYGDDAQVVELSVWKRYVGVGETAGVEIVVRSAA